MIALVAIAMTAQAQKPVQEISQAFDEFYSKLYKAGYATSSSQDNYKEGYKKELYFALPMDKDKIVKEYDNLLFDYGRLAYSSLVKKAGTKNTSTLDIAYGEGNKQSHNFGSYSNRNYNVQLVRDRKDSTMRYAYALVWYKENDSIIGSMYKFYGKDPKKKTSRDVLRKGGWTIDKDGIVGPGVVIDDDGIQLAEGVKLEDLMKELKGLESLGVTSDDINNIDINDDDEEDRLSPDSNDSTKIKTSEDIIQRFNNLQVVYSKLNNKYKDYKKFSGADRLKMLNTRRLMIATNNQIRMLVNSGRYGNMLSSDDKGFIADQLKEMSNESKDKWLKKSLNDLSTSLLK